jgi:hypothetical protein
VSDGGSGGDALPHCMASRSGVSIGAQYHCVAQRDAVTSVMTD